MNFERRGRWHSRLSVSRWPKGLALASLVWLGVAARWLPHPANFTPVLALALFLGAYHRRSFSAAAIVLGVLFLSDLVLGFHRLMLPIYMITAGVAVCASFWLRDLHREKAAGITATDRAGGAARVGVAGLAASTLFFILSNFAVWWTGDLYELTWAGLLECYIMAIPFFFNTLFSTWLYSALLFGSMGWLVRRVPALRREFVDTTQR